MLILEKMSKPIFMNLYNGHTYREPSYDDFSRYINQLDPAVRTQKSFFLGT